ALVSARLPQIPTLRRVLKAAPLGLGHPLWMEVTQVNLHQHIIERRLRAPGSDRQLQAL
ncbi:MAG: wax ester/triacylglycerol synthase family O-acyltransferase, partial [Lysobacterales bacterium CG_4_9_14_3_um_filter_62_6]